MNNTSANLRLIIRRHPECLYDSRMAFIKYLQMFQNIEVSAALEAAILSSDMPNMGSIERQLAKMRRRKEKIGQ